MATRDALLQRRIVATERIKAALPGVQFRKLPAMAGSEAQHVNDLETVADAVEKADGAKKENSRE